jgi:cytochrome oxidase Cu insertion factor (SCO1/SenC/PrrC family)
MPGMGTGLSANNPTVVSAFHAALLGEGLIVLLIFLAVALAWSVLRTAQLHRAFQEANRAVQGGSRAAQEGDLAVQDRDTSDGQGTQEAASRSSSEATSIQGTRKAPTRTGHNKPLPLLPAPPPPTLEPPARRLLRVGFGILWVFDGILQGQASMPLGMAPQVIEPAAASSPSWVQHLDNAMATIWSYHPIAAPAAAVWIQVGLGAWLLAARRGELSRLAGVASAAWGLVVWIFGEAFGQIFAPGLSWAFGAPGPVLFYALAGILIALPLRAWPGPRLGKVLLWAMGAFFLGMALLQAWPGRGFWEGGPKGSLSSMASQMSQTPQPHVLASWVASFAAFDSRHGWGVNLFMVVALAATGAAFLSGHPRLVRWGVAFSVVFCLATWVLVQDLGVLGGVGTDPNSMIPMALVLTSGYLALRHRLASTEALAVAAAEAEVDARRAKPAPVRGKLRRLWGEVVADPTYAFRSVAALGAIGVCLVGAVPMAVAATEPNASAILTQAVDGSPDEVKIQAPNFSLVDQHGNTVTLASLRGKAVVLTFLDPVCTSDCPVIAQELRAADQMLSSKQRGRTEFVAVDANPRYIATPYLVAFDEQEGLRSTRNWLYLTGSLPQLQRVWGSYGVQVNYEPGGAMIGHSDLAYVIDPAGQTRFVFDADPGPATQATRSSFAATIAGTLEDLLRSAPRSQLRSAPRSQPATAAAP